MSALLSKRCERCDGRMMRDKDQWCEYDSCIVCGYQLNYQEPRRKRRVRQMAAPVEEAVAKKFKHPGFSTAGEWHLSPTTFAELAESLE